MRVHVIQRYTRDDHVIDMILSSIRNSRGLVSQSETQTCVRGARLMRLPDATYRESSPDKAGENPLAIRMRS